MVLDVPVLKHFRVYTTFFEVSIEFTIFRNQYNIVFQKTKKQKKKIEESFIRAGAFMRINMVYQKYSNYSIWFPSYYVFLLSF